MAAEIEKVQPSTDVFMFPNQFEQHHNDGMLAKAKKR